MMSSSISSRYPIVAILIIFIFLNADGYLHPPASLCQSRFRGSQTKRISNHRYYQPLLSTSSSVIEEDEDIESTISDAIVIRAASVEQKTTLPEGIEIGEPSSSTSDEGEPLVQQDEIRIPSYSTILTFLSTTVLIWLSEPLLSLIDTTIIGHTAQITGLAALGPATMLIDSLLYLTYFLSIATTNKLVIAIAKNDESDQKRITSHVLGVAAVLGLTIMAIVMLGGKQILSWMLTDDTREVLSQSLSYARVRSIAAPLSVMGMVAQSAALASLDTFTPFLAVVVTSLLNVAGDVLLCLKPFQLGVTGAAIATAIANAAGSLVLLAATKRRMKKLSDKTQSIPFVSLPDRQSLIKLVKLAGPIFFVIVGKMVFYTAMTLRATDFGMAALACHNVMVRIFFFYATFGDSLSQTAQTFLPHSLIAAEKQEEIAAATTATTKVAEPEKKQKNPIFSLLKRLLVISSVFALINSRVSTFLLRNKAQYFTTNLDVSALMSQSSHLIGIILAIHPFVLLLEGSMIAQRDLKYLVGSYALTVGAMLFSIFGFCKEFEGVWMSLVWVNVVRGVLFGWRGWRKLRRWKKEEKREKGVAMS